MPDRVPAAEVHPDSWRGLYGRARDEQELIAFVDGGNVLGAVAENNAMNGRPEPCGAPVGERRRHNNSWRGSE